MSEKNKQIDKYLIETKFPAELKKIPKGELNEEEQVIADKILNKEEITDDEFQQIKKTINRWRKAINKYDIDEIEDAQEKTVQIIKTSQELIDIMDDDDNRKITCELTYFGKIYQMTFNVKPLNDSRALQALSLDLDLFKDYSARDKQVYAKSQTGQKLTPEEQKIVEAINESINNNVEENQEELITKFLARQLRLADETEDNYEQRVEFWQKFPLNQRVSTFLEVEKLLGLTEDDNYKLFPTSK